MGFADTFIGKLLITAIGGILSTIVGILLVLLLGYVFAKYGVIPFVVDHLHIPRWLIDLLSI
jgi:hypothetical protein